MGAMVRQEPVAIPMAAFAMIAAFESSGALTPYTYPIFFIVVFVWVGLCQPPRTSFLLAPIAALSYLFPVSGDLDTVGARDSAFVVLPVCVLLAEVISRAVSDLRSAHLGMSRLLQAAKALTTVSNTEEATDLVAALAYDLLDASAVIVFVSDPPQSQRLVASAWRNVPPEGQQMVIDTESEPSGAGLAVRRGATVFIGDHVSLQMNPRLQELTGAEAGVFFPLPGEASFIGAISAMWTRPRARLESFTRQAIELLSLEAGRVLERLMATRDLQRQAERDPLTGLLNRRSLQNALETAGPADALVLIDLDHFKAVNDRYGHVAGDNVLVSFAQCMQSAARGSDSVARFGGEEFALLLREGGPDGAAAVIERLRALWAQTNPPTTFSAGIALREGNESVSHALQRADEALYAAKHAWEKPYRDRALLA